MGNTSTKKQTALPLEARVAQCITTFPAPKTTQDTVDKLCAEFATASYLRTFAEKRYEAAKTAVVEAYNSEVDEVRQRSSELMAKTTASVAGEDWLVIFAANKPSLRTSVDELRTELVRLGIDVDLIDRAINKVTKKATPALIITVEARNGGN